MVYLIYGTQSIRIKTRINKIVKEKLPEKDDMNYVRYDGSNVLIQEWLDDVNYLPLGYENKVVIVDNCYFFEKKRQKNKIESEQDYDALERYLKDQNDFTDLILTIVSEEVDPKGKLYSLIKQYGTIFQIVDPDPKEWKQYVIKLCREKLQIQIDQNALSEITIRTACDVDLLLNTLDKLSLYTDHITYDDVLLMVPKPLEENAFQIFNYLISGKNELAIALFRDLRVNNVEPVTLISMLSNQFRLLNQVAFLSRTGSGEDEIAQELNIKPIRVSILRKNLYSISEKTIHKVLEDLFQLDLQIKSGQVDRYYAFELFLINFKRK